MVAFGSLDFKFCECPLCGADHELETNKVKRIRAMVNKDIVKQLALPESTSKQEVLCAFCFLVCFL